jgi:hypothetical protein
MSFLRSLIGFKFPRSITSYWGLQFDCICGHHWTAPDLQAREVIQRRLNECRKCGKPARYYRKRFSLL